MLQLLEYVKESGELDRHQNIVKKKIDNDIKKAHKVQAALKKIQYGDDYVSDTHSWDDTLTEESSDWSQESSCFDD